MIHDHQRAEAHEGRRVGNGAFVDRPDRRALRRRDIDTHRATVWLREKNDTEREQPVSPSLIALSHRHSLARCARYAPAMIDLDMMTYPRQRAWVQERARKAEAAGPASRKKVSPAARKRARGRATTVAIDAMVFLRAVSVGDLVAFYTDIQSIGRSSMKILVEVWGVSDQLETRTKLTEGLFTFVAIDESGRTRALPPLN